MLRWKTIAAVFMLTLWMPATGHCALEAAGLFAKTCFDNCTTGQNCAKDGCGAVEDGAYRASADTVKVPAPSLLACVCYSSSRLLNLDAVRAPVILPSESFDRSRDWVSTWHFVRRAAPAPRAPSLSIA